MRASFVSAVLLLVALSAPALAGAGGGDDEARARMDCAGGRAELRLRSEEDDGERTLELELRVDGRRGVQRLRLVILHERALVYSGVRRTGRDGRLRLERTVADWPGRETVTARIGLPSGRTCVLQAAI